MFSHVGHVESQSTSRTTKNVSTCKNGLSCEWLAKQRCSFFHPRIGVQNTWTREDSGQGGHQVNRFNKEPRRQPRDQAEPNKQSDRVVCRFNGRCERIPNCQYLHFNEDFPKLQGRRNSVMRRNINQRRN